MQLASFGCSLIYGNELSDNGFGLPSQQSWPALLAKKFDLDYGCFAGGGRGNLMIMDRLTSQIHKNPDRVFVIQWTYIDRFDYSDPDGHHLSGKGSNDYLTLLPRQDTPTSNFYFRNLHSEFRDKITNLVYMKTALDLLIEKRCRFLMTCIDDLIWCDQYNTTRAMPAWQTYIKDHMTFFEDKNFVQWSRDKNLPMGREGHPLDQAHAAAADIMVPTIDAILRRA